MARLKDLYNSEIKEAMTKKFGYKNVMEIPKIDKIVINMEKLRKIPRFSTVQCVISRSSLVSML